VLATKFAQLEVTGSVEPVAMLFCLLLRLDEILELSQKEAELELRDHDDVIGYVEPVFIVPA
jgi:hypothetical protein